MVDSRHTFATIDGFKTAAKSAAASTGVALLKEYQARVKAEDGKPLTIAISTATPDRMNDTVSVRGWQLDAYAKNPVVLWAHDKGALPVAKANRVWIEGEALMSEPEFTPRDLYELGWTVGEMLRRGFLNAASVGFRPLKYVFNEERGPMAMDFEEQELLEYSIVPIPANPEALVQAKAAGIDLRSVHEWAVKFLDGEGSTLILPRDAVEKAWKATGGGTTTSIPKEAPVAKTADLTVGIDTSAVDAAAAKLEAATKAATEAAERLEKAQAEKTKADPSAECSHSCKAHCPDMPAEDGKSASAEVVKALRDEVVTLVRASVAEEFKNLKTALTGRLD